MNKKVKLLADIEIDGVKYIKDSVLELDVKTADDLIGKKTAELFDEAAEKQLEKDKKEADETLADLIAKAVGAAVTAANEKAANIVVGETLSHLDLKGGYESEGHFLQDVAKAARGETTKILSTWSTTVKQIFKAAEGQSEGLDADGGFFVPRQFGDAHIPPALEDSVVASKATQLQMTSKTLSMPTIVDNSHAASRYGVVTYWKGEAKEYTKSKIETGEIELTAHKLTALAYMTDELMEDAPALTSFIQQIIPMALGYSMDQAFLFGDGAGKPLGMLNAANAALLAIDKEGGQAAATIVYQNLLKMRARHRMIQNGSTLWAANQDAMLQFDQLLLEGSSTSIPVYTPANGLSQNDLDSLWKKPIVYSEKMKAVGTQGDVALLDASQYYVGNRTGIKATSSSHVRFLTDETAFKFSARLAGQPIWDSVFTPENGSTRSPYVVVKVRA